MPNTSTSFTGTGITGPYACTFDPPLDDGDLYITLDAVPTSLWTYNLSTNVVTFDSVVATDVAIIIQRQTTTYPELVTFADGAVDKAASRNLAMRQNLYRLQEIDETSTGPAGADGADGADGSDGADGWVLGTEGTVTPLAADKLLIADASAADVPKFALLTDFAILDARQAFTKGQYSTYTAMGWAASIAPNFEAANVFGVTLTGNTTIANPTNIVVGQEIAVLLRQDAGGTNTGAFGSYWLFPGGTPPTLTVAGDALDLIVGVVVSATEILCDSKLDIK